MEPYDQYAHDRCDRCCGYMSARAMSYFTEEFICMECLRSERALLARLRERRVDVARLANCGHVPDEADRPGSA